MKKIKLDKEEQEILDAYENGEFQSVPNVKKEIEIEQAVIGLSLPHHLLSYHIL